MRQPQGLVSFDVDLPEVCRPIRHQRRHTYIHITFQTKLKVESSSPLHALPIWDIRLPNWVQESKTSPLLDSIPTLSIPTFFHPPLETAEMEAGDMISDDDETNCEEAFTGLLIRVF